MLKIILLLTWCCLALHAQSPAIQWSPLKSKGTISASGKHMEVVFPSGKWSALLGQARLPKDFSGNAIFTAECHLQGDFSHLKHTEATISFTDGADQKIGSAASPASKAVIRQRAGRQPLHLTCAVPPGTVNVHIHITSHGGGTLLIDAPTLRLKPVRLSTADMSDDIILQSSESLSNSYLWQAVNSTYTPMQGNQPGSIAFPAGKWSALIGRIPLDPQGKRNITVTAECRLLGELKNLKYTSMALIFEDEKHQKINTPSTRQNAVKLTDDNHWNRYQLESAIPPGAVQLRIDFASHGGATMEIRFVEIRLKETNPTEAAVLGLELPGWTPKNSTAGKPTPNQAHVEVFEKCPFELGHDFWKQKPRYQIPATTCNKSPRTNHDASADFRLAADPNYLYVYFSACDDRLNFKSQTRYCRDAFELFFMPTGRFQNPRATIRHEQYTVTRTEQGETDANTEALTRLTKAGWEALIRIPLKNEIRRIYPFNGLQLTFNAAYQDTDSIEQEHWMSFSAKDQTNLSWNKPELYVPLTFVTTLPLNYHPIWLGDAAEYNVDPKYDGQINLIDFPAAVENLGFWEGFPETQVTVKNNAYHFAWLKPATRNLRIQLPVFSVLPGEIIDFEYEGRSDHTGIPAVGGGFVSQANWAGFAMRKIHGPQSFTKTWTPFRFRGTVPQKMRQNMRSGRLLITWKCQQGKAFEIRKLKIFRRTPVNLDAKLFVDDFYSHWQKNAPKRIALMVATPTAQNVTVEVELMDVYAKKVTARLTRNLSLKPGLQTWQFTFPQDIPLGFYNVTARIRTPQGKFLADREVYVANYLPAENLNPASGIFIHDLPELTPPQNINPMAETIAAMGEGTVAIMNLRPFDSQNRHSPIAARMIKNLQAFKRLGLKLDTMLGRGNSYVPAPQQNQPGESVTYWKRYLNCVGPDLVDYWHFENEPNLWCDAQEWAAYQPGFYHAVKNADPKAKVLLGNFNSIPETYLSEVHNQLGRGFAEGVIGVHLYGVEFNGNGFDNLLKARNHYEKLYPGWKVWDMESGSVYHTFAYLSEMMTKKMPIHLSAGIDRTLFYNDRDFFLPHADATPHVATDAFKTRFYLHVTPLGRAKLNHGAIHAYCFQRPNGSGAVVLWNTKPTETTLDMPTWKQATCFDQFGNPMTFKGTLKLKDRFVRYFNHVPVQELMTTADFVPAFRSTFSAPATIDQEQVQDIYLYPEQATNGFDVQLAPNQEVAVVLHYVNAGANQEVVVPTAHGPDGVQATFSPATLTLAPGRDCEVTLSLKAQGKFPAGPLSIGGKLSQHKMLIPRIISLTPAPPLAVIGYSRCITIRNNSDHSLDVAATPNMDSYYVTPNSLQKRRLKPGEEAVLPFSVALREANAPGKPRLLNVPDTYQLMIRAGTLEFPATGVMYGFAPENIEDADFARLKYTLKKAGLRIDYQLMSTRQHDLRLAMRIHDHTPNQSHTLGFIKNGGDAVIIALKQGNDYREYGFSPGNETPQAYLWKGKYGMETAVKPPANIIRKLERHAKYWDLDVVIPRMGLKQGDAMSIRIVDRNAQGKDRIINLGEGIVPRNHKLMGIIIR